MVEIAESEYRDASGRLATGALIVSWPFFSNGTENIASGSITETIDDGVFSVSLEANEAADPPFNYTVIFRLQESSFSQQWKVPDSDDPLSVQDVVWSSNSPVTVGLNQFRRVGYSEGDIPVFDGSEWVPLHLGSATTGQALTVDTGVSKKLKYSTVSGGGGGAWGSIAGTLGDQTDLSAALATKLVKTSNLADLTSASTARTNLGLGTAATASSGSFAAASHTHAAADVVSGQFPISRIAVPSGSPKVVYASTISGIHLDGSLSANTGTDDKALIQAVLDTASATSPLLLIMDGVAAISTVSAGLVVKSFTAIWGLGRNTGFCWLGSATANQQVLLTNANPLGTGTPTDKNIALWNFCINGNDVAGHGGSGTYPLVTNSAGLFLACIRLTGVTGLALEDLKTVRAPSYGIHVANATDLYINRCRHEHDVARVGTDGTHVNGPTSNFYIGNISGFTGDDLVAMNADDGHQTGSTGNVGCFGDNTLASTIKFGPITKGLVEGIYSEGCWSALRLLSAISAIDAVTIRGVKGTTFHRAMYIDNDPGELASVGGGNFGNLVIEDVDIVPTAIPDDGAIVLAAAFKSLRLGIRCTNHSVAKPYIITDSTTSINQLVLDIGNSSNSSGLPNPILSIPAGTVKHLLVTGQHDAGSGTTQSTQPIVSISGGTVETVSFSDIYADRIDTVLSISGGSVDALIFGHGRHLRAGGNPTVSLGSGVVIPSGIISGFATVLFYGGAGTVGTFFSGIVSDTVPDPGASGIAVGLTAFWPLTEATGAARADATGNGHTLANNGTVLQASASPLAGNVVAFDGNAANFLSTAGASFTVSGSTGFTISLWVRLKNLVDNHIFVSKRGPDGSHHEVAVYSLPDNGRFQLHVNGTIVDYTIISPSTDIWYHICGGWSPVDSKVFLTVDNAGIQQSSTGSPAADTGNGLRLGEIVGVSCHADMGHVGWWSRVLTAPEITMLFNAGAFLDPV